MNILVHCGRGNIVFIPIHRPLETAKKTDNRTYLPREWEEMSTEHTLMNYILVISVFSSKQSRV
jgi:hypothetical protein